MAGPTGLSSSRDELGELKHFGLAKAFSVEVDVPAETPESPTETKGTALGAIMGTPSYELHRITNRRHALPNN